jgi:hypothetical protein
MFGQYPAFVFVYPFFLHANANYAVARVSRES